MTKGKWMGLFLLAAVLALGTPKSVMAQAQGTDAGAAAAAAPAEDEEMSYPARFALGCVGAAGAALTGTYLAGPTEAMLLLGGGLLTASSTTLLNLALLGQIGAASCAIGATVAPTVLWTYGESDKIWAKVTRQASAMGSAALAAVGLGGETSRQVADGASAR